MLTIFKLTRSTSTLLVIGCFFLFNTQKAFNGAFGCNIDALDSRSSSNTIAHPDNDTWVLCHMFGAIGDLSSNYNWFSTDNPNPCTNGSSNWTFITCNEEDRVIGLGNFETVGSNNDNITQIINTTYWPQKIQSIVIDNDNFLGGELHFDNLPNTTQTVMISSKSDWSNFTINVSQFPDLVRCTNLTTFRLDDIYLFGENSHIRLINSLPINLQNFELHSKSTYRFLWTLDKFPNFTHFGQLEILDISGCDIIDTDSFVSTILPPNIKTLYGDYNRLTGKLDFSSLLQNRNNETSLKRVIVDGNQFSIVNFIGIDEITEMGLDQGMICDPKGYFMHKDDEIGNPNFTISDSNRCEIGNRYRQGYCTGITECFNSYCLCFTIPNDWQPAFNDFYTISLTIVLVTLAVTSIAFANLNCFNFDLIYLKLVSIQVILVMIAWFWLTLILGPNIPEKTADGFVTGAAEIVIVYWLFVLYPLSIMLGTMTSFSNFYFMKKFNLVTKVKIDNKYKDLIESDTVHGCDYFVVGPNALDCSKNDYWKLVIKNNNWLMYKCNRKRRVFTALTSSLSFTMCQLFYVWWIWILLILLVTFSLCCNWLDSERTMNSFFGFWVLLLVLLGIKMILMIGSPFARYHFWLADFALIMMNISIQYITINGGADDHRFSSIRNFLFKTGDYYGGVDELNTGKQGTVLTYMNGVQRVISVWCMTLFCLVSTILYIKCNRRAKIKDSPIFQLNVTVVSLFTGLLDYLTDILVIMYWIYHRWYVYAAFEVSFIVFGQVAATYLIQDVPYYVNFNYGNASNKNPDDTRKASSMCNVLKTIIFGLGFSRIYHSVKHWDNKLIEYEYKWCKLWELMFESIPSVVLSTYVAFIDTSSSTNDSLNPSVIISMVFSFINITNTIVVIFSKDQNNNNNNNNNTNKNRNTNADTDTQKHDTIVVPTSHFSLSVENDEKIAAHIINIDLQVATLKRNNPDPNQKDQNDQDHVRTNDMDHEQKERSANNCNTAPSQNRSLLQLPSDLWVFDTTTNEVTFFAEEKKQPSRTNNTTIARKTCDTIWCKTQCKRFCYFLFHFDAKIQNFMIWLFLTTDLFLRVLSVLSVIMVLNYAFLGQEAISNDAINLIQSSVAGDHDSTLNGDLNSFILRSFYATTLNLLFLMYVLIIEYLLFGFMLTNHSSFNVNQGKIDRCGSVSDDGANYHQSGDDNVNIQKIAILKRSIRSKYFVVGLFSNCFYFLLTIGVEYIPRMIDKQVFFKCQFYRTILSVFFLCCHVLANLWLDVFVLELYLGAVILVLFHCISLWSVKIRV